MTLLPRMTTSPIVVASAGTSTSSSPSVSVRTTRARSAVSMPTPCRASFAARVGPSSSDHSVCHSHTVYGPYVSVRP